MTLLTELTFASHPNPLTFQKIILISTHPLCFNPPWVLLIVWYLNTCQRFWNVNKSDDSWCGRPMQISWRRSEQINSLLSVFVWCSLVFAFIAYSLCTDLGFGLTTFTWSWSFICVSCMHYNAIHWTILAKPSAKQFASWSRPNKSILRLWIGMSNSPYEALDQVEKCTHNRTPREADQNLKKRKLQPGQKHIQACQDHLRIGTSENQIDSASDSTGCINILLERGLEYIMTQTLG